MTDELSPLAKALQLWSDERALADALFTTLGHTVAGWKHGAGFDLADEAEVEAVSARYREARQ